MAVNVQYELVCVDSAQSEEDVALGIFFPLEAVTTDELEKAHRVAFALLDYRPTDRAEHLYAGRCG
ncbi:hypothetical protein RD110_01160 [Rhodoferax koreense]|uniref:Uncharacterized protein n=1 Tax=Rhodoferax koreensis TaxID=1842727 RepID=A0A1P8JQE7_9BURK|nr:hypothetical protein [Rhodoferax koreense]APW35987.1 hypothetical protein RD110_01160 [Rhodoferax koreense]